MGGIAQLDLPGMGDGGNGTVRRGLVIRGTGRTGRAGVGVEICLTRVSVWRNSLDMTIKTYWAWERIGENGGIRGSLTGLHIPSNRILDRKSVSIQNEVMSLRAHSPSQSWPASVVFDSRPHQQDPTLMGLEVQDRGR